MSHSATVIDMTQYRKRKLAQHHGRLLWAMYAQQCGFAAQPLNVGRVDAKAPRQA